MKRSALGEEVVDEAAGIRPVGRGRVLARLLGGGALVLFVPVLVLAVAANGVTVSGLSLGAALLALGLMTLVRPPTGRSGRVALFAVAGVCGIGVLTFVVGRLLVTPPPGAFRFVEEGRRDASPPWLSRLADERETVLGGLYFSNVLGLVEGRERDHLDRLLRGAYPETWRPWPNAAVIDSAPGMARHLEHVPAGSATVPCIVFLHGFGGQLTAYLRVLDEAFGDRYVIVAPFLDYTGAFWTPRGKGVVGDLVTKHLPSEVDRGRVFLVGLSNGAAGATAILQDAELSRLFRGFVLVSGMREVVEPMVRANVLLLAGTEDPRFPLRSVRSAADALRESGARVEMETFPADHFLWLSHSREMTGSMGAWLSRQGGE